MSWDLLEEEIKLVGEETEALFNGLISGLTNKHADLECERMVGQRGTTVEDTIKKYLGIIYLG